MQKESTACCFNDHHTVSKSSHYQRKGFALIATISVMTLLVLIALAMLSLSTIQSRQNNASNDHAIAQANARMALMIAIGELQKSLGPDQRVSATASIFDTDPTSLEIDDVSMPHTLGVWSTLTADGEPIIYQADEGYHMDRRNPSDDSFEDHRENVMSWLISGGDQPGFDPRTTTLIEGDNAVALGIENANLPLEEIGQNANANPTKVLAPLVNTFNNGIENKYAYHVTDLGMAAPLVQLNTNVGTTPDATDAENGGYANLYTGSKRPYGNLNVTADEFSDIAEDVTVSDINDTSRYISYNTLSFSPDNNTNADAIEFLRSNDQSFCLTNSALFVDTLRGGLRTDLSSFLENDADPGDGSLVGSSDTILVDRDPILDHERFEVLSPKFGALRDYIRLGDEIGTNNKISPRAPIYGTGGYRNDYPDPTQVIKQGIHPHIIEYSVYQLPVLNSNSSSSVSSLIYPRVTLWNPYNVTINAANYFVQINQRDLFTINVESTDSTVTPAPGTTNSGTYQYSATSGTLLSNDGTWARNNYLFFFLSPVDIEPGQALVFTPAHSGSQKLESRDGAIIQNTLSANANPANLSSFYVDMTGGNGTPLDENLDLEYTFSGRYFVGSQESTSARLRLSQGNTTYSSIIGGTDESPSAPIVHTFDNHNWVRDNQSRFRVMDDGDPPLLLNINDTASLIPDHRTKLGIRLKAFNETAENLNNNPNVPWNFPFLEMSNMRAPFYRRTPWDWVIERAEVYQEFHFGPFASESTPNPGYTDSFMLPRFTNGLAETSPFLNTSSTANIRFPLFDIPPANLKAFSFAQFRPATLTYEFSAPSFIIGESLVPVTAPRDKSALSVADYSEAWWDGIRQSQVTSFATWWQPELDPSINYSAYDTRYEVNHALWDKYFLSTFPSGDLLDDYTTPGSLPNQNVSVSTDIADSLTLPTEARADRIAQHLRLQNHHSVNSTNLIAWKALLSMNLGMEINGQATDTDSVPFPGMSKPLGDGTTSTNSQDADTWEGYKQLNSSEIDSLSEQIVEQVKRRAPFISISDFVNRRLRESESAITGSPDIDEQTDVDLLSYAGPIEVAIRKAKINTELQDFPLEEANQYEAPVFKPGKNEVQPYDTINTPEERFTNAPAHLTQGKVMETIGASLTSRSDTFRVRAYGESRDNAGNIKARAWCEAIVQRTASYLDSTDEATVGVDDLTSLTNQEFGRRFKIQSFRWLGNNEVEFN